MNPMDLKRGIDLAVSDVVGAIEKVQSGSTPQVKLRRLGLSLLMAMKKLGI